MVIRIVFTLFLVLISISSCSQGIDGVSLNVDHEINTPPASPSKGNATIIGRVKDIVEKTPYPDKVLRLAEVVRQDGEGVYVLDQAFSPGARSDNDGYFIFENVEPMEYVIIVGNVEDIHDVVEDDAGLPKVWRAEAGEILDVGELFVSLNVTSD